MTPANINDAEFVRDTEEYCLELEELGGMRFVCCGTRQEHQDGTITDHEFQGG